MRILDNYIARVVISSTCMVVLILLGVESFVQFIGELGDIGSQNYGMFQALMYVPMTLPADLYQLFPMAGLLGSLLGLGRLASNNELVVMRAAGVSKAKLTWAVVRAAFVMMVFVTLIGEFIAPSLFNFAERFKSSAMGNVVGYTALQHIWMKQDSRFIHIDQVDNPKRISGVTQYNFNHEHRLKSVIVAQHALLVNGVWHLIKPAVTSIAADKVTTKHLKRISLNLNFDPKLVEMSRQEPSESSIVKLFENIRYRHSYGLNSDQYAFAFWQRLVQPLTTIVMICLGVPFIFGSLRNSTMGYRITMGILIGFGFYMLNQFFGPFSLVYQFPPWLAAMLPTIIFAIAGWMMMRKAI
ncbi:MAG: LPS export ABC transporter permease LptG [Coxiellaceae bacterium]|nr:LPS export ABC transporter permease LptG [Coxiellaceae bacterium]